jgi:hypothetical protein
MRRITRATWLVLFGALVASALSVVALVRVAHQPRLATPLGSGSAPLLTAITPSGILVLTPTGGQRIDGQGRATPLRSRGVLRSIRSAAWWDGALALVANVEEDARESSQLLIVEHDAITSVRVGGLQRIAVLGGEQLRVFTVIDDHHVDARTVERDGDGWRVEAPAETRFALVDSVEGVLDVGGQPYLLIGERGAHWMVDRLQHLWPIPAGAFSVWSASVLRPPLNSPSRVPYLDGAGHALAFTPVGAPTLVVDADGELTALPVTRGVDEPGVFVTNFGKHRLEVKHAHRRVLASSDQVPAWRAVATSVLPDDFLALPLPGSDLWLLTDRSCTERVVVDGALNRYDQGDASATFAALTSQPRGVWLGLLGLLIVLAAAAPLVVRRARRELRILDYGDGLFLGALKLPPGSVGQTDRRGLVPLSGDSQLRSGAHVFDLSSGARRFDDAGSAPLVDGDRVFVVGRVESDQAGGPWRASHRQRLGPDGGRFLIGRGNADDFARHLTARANARLFAFALVHLTLALSVLGFLGLRPYI